MKQIEVQIMGQSYLLGCPDGGESHLMSAVEKVDSAMCKIRDAAKIKARERIAVLAALNLAFDQVEKSEQPASKHSTDSTQAKEDYLYEEINENSLTLLIHKLDTALAEDGRLF
ncbi:MAG: cell division protein ZapA [Burkholderiaceae bacterium]